MAISNGVEKYLRIAQKLSHEKHRANRSEDFCTILAELRLQKRKLISRYCHFIRDGYKRFSTLSDEFDCNDEVAHKIITRFNRTIKPSTQNLLACIDKSIAKCIKLKRTGV